MAPRCVLGSVLLATLSYAETVLAQVPPPGPPATMLGAGQSVAMTTEEQLSIERTIVSDPRVRAIVSEAQPRIITAADELDKSEAEAFLEGRTTTPPTRRVTIVVINPQSQQAARVLFELPDNRILGACPNSRCSILSESDSTLGDEQVFSPLEYRSDAASAAECA
jgi:hypothetical protein